ncbi:hypothetical protein [Oceanobacillus sp. CAU 1775]
MGKSISIFVLSTLISVLLFFILGFIFGVGDYPETAVYIFGTIIVILLSFLISLIFYMMELIKNKY